MARIEKTVFISYRRKDISWALAVYQYLTSQKYDVFFDYTSIPSGDFEQIIVSNIKARAHFILILTPTALDRCNEPGDWLRREIETAVDEKRNIIPLFFDEFKFGSPNVAEKLTGKLANINRYNGLDIPSGYFLEAMERLRNRYLNVPLDAVIHPVSTEVQEVVIKEKHAANQAVRRQKNEIEEHIKPVQEKPEESTRSSIKNVPESSPAASKKYHVSQGKVALDRITTRFKKINPRPLGIGIGVLLISIIGIFSINSLIKNLSKGKTLDPTQTRDLAIESSTTPTIPGEINTPAVTFTPTPVPPSVTPTSRFSIGSTIPGKEGMTLLYIPAGEFTMGNNDSYRDERPAHAVTLDAFWFDRTEITNVMYAMCVLDGDCVPPDYDVSYTRGSYFGNSRFDNYPVIYASWFDANSYCSWAGRRLPTEAEWEKVASGLNGLRYPWGGVIDCSFANYRDKLDFCVRDTVSVGSYPKGASSYGAMDMAGNVWEWVHDWYGDTYYADSPTSNPQGPISGVDRVLRGGSFYTDISSLTTHNRYFSHPTNSLYHFGIRCAMDAE